MDPFLTISLIFILIITSGIFSLFDHSLNACRKSRLEKEKSSRYKTILKMLEEQNDDSIHKLTSKQNLSSASRLLRNILIALAVFLSGKFIFITTLNNNSEHFMITALALSTLILGTVIVIFTGALPKLFSQTKPEKIAASLLPAVKIFAVPLLPLTLPLLQFTSFFNRKIRPAIDDNNITEEQLQDDLRNTLIEGEKSGIVESKERSMVEGVFYLGDRPVAAFMTHRSEIQWFDISAPYDEVRKKAVLYREQRCFPVADGSPDEIAGVVYLEDILLAPDQQNLRAIMKKAQFVPETMTALKAFESFKHGHADFLLVMDEYGGLAGIISIRALVEEIVGELSAPAGGEMPLILQEDGSYLADGTLNIDDAAKELSLTGLDEDGEYHTIAGFILNLAGELPKAGDSYEYQEYKFTVKEMDGNRIDKLVIAKIE